MMRVWVWKSCCLGGPEKAGGGGSSMLWSCKSASLWVIVLLLSLSSVALLAYIAVFSSPGHLFPWTMTTVSAECAEVHAAAGGALTPTNISHIVFGIAGSGRTWEKRRPYSELWWRGGVTRGYVWLDEEAQGSGNRSSNWSCPPWCPPHRISGNASRLGPRVSAARIARIVTESYRVVAEGSGWNETRWLVMGDDDTVFFPDNLVAVLGKYDHREVYYVGGWSESVEQDVLHSYGMAFGGGGFAVSLPAAAEMAGVLDGCLARYARLYGSDERVKACLSELGVPLTREPGFHQLDIRGDPFGLLAAHPVGPLVSLHHLDAVKPIFPELPTQLDAVRKLVDASRLDPAGILQQSICYEQRLKWSVSVSWGYAVVVYPRVIPPRELEVPLQTFQTWRSFKDGPFTFNTRPLEQDPCDRPLVYYLHLPGVNGSAVGMTEYASVDGEGERRRKACGNRSELVSASKVRTVRVEATRMDPSDWKRAPRRRCCEVKRSWWGNRLDVRIRKCRHGENMSPP